MIHVYTSPPTAVPAVHGIGDSLSVLPVVKALREKTGERVVFHLFRRQADWVQLFWKDVFIEHPGAQFYGMPQDPSEQILVSGFYNNNTKDDILAASKGMTRRELIANRWGVEITRDAYAPLVTAERSLDAFEGFNRFFDWDTTKPLVILCPDANDLNRTWPGYKYVQLAEALKTQYRVLILGCENNRVESWMSLGIAALSKISPEHVLALVQNCALLIGNDSGMTNLAALLCKPSIAICAPTRGSIIFGDRPTTRVIQGNTRPCSGCLYLGKNGWKPSCNVGCVVMNEIETGTVLSTALSMLAYESSLRVVS